MSTADHNQQATGDGGNRRVQCETCKGSGKDKRGKACWSCYGLGFDLWATAVQQVTASDKAEPLAYALLAVAEAIQHLDLSHTAG
jgi:hypothetical protein